MDGLCTTVIQVPIEEDSQKFRKIIEKFGVLVPGKVTASWFRLLYCRFKLDLSIPFNYQKQLIRVYLKLMLIEPTYKE